MKGPVSMLYYYILLYTAQLDYSNCLVLAFDCYYGVFFYNIRYLAISLALVAFTRLKLNFSVFVQKGDNHTIYSLLKL